VTAAVHIYADRAAWLAARVGAPDEHRIGGSDVAAILGVSRFAGPWDLYAERVLGIKREATAAREADFRRGNLLERYVLEEYAHRTSHSVHHADEIVHLVDDWRVGSPDALATDLDGVRGGVEAKTSRDAHEWGEDGAEIADYERDGGASIVPPYYALQVYWYLDLSGLPWWDVAVLLPWYEVRAYRIWRDEALQARIVAQVSAWRRRHLVEREAPDLDASEACKRAMEAKYQAAREAARTAKRVAIAEGDAVELVERYVANAEAEKAAKVEKDLAANRLRQITGEAGLYGLAHPSGRGRVTVGKGGRITTSGF
jgi:predicted phage-related endonuclease